MSNWCVSRPSAAKSASRSFATEGFWGLFFDAALGAAALLFGFATLVLALFFDPIAQYREGRATSICGVPIAITVTQG